MIFKENKPIYIQIADKIADDVLSGLMAADERIPSVREMAVTLEVNANTVVRSYDYLQNSGVIYNRRGLGYFVSPEAVEKITAERRKHLMGDELGQVFSRIATIGVTPDELKELYAKFLASK